MSYPRVTLRRNKDNRLSGEPDDTLRLHEHERGTWIVVDDHQGDTVLVIYNLTDGQLASLHAAIGRKVGLAPEMTMEHARQLHSLLGDVIVRKDEEMRAQSPFAD